MKQIKGICLITNDVARLRNFYRAVLQMEVNGDDTYTAFQMGGVTFSLFDEREMERMAPGSMQHAGCGRCVVELQVNDVDHEFERLNRLNVPIVKPPTTQPWGLRSVWLRDPDGNIVNFFAPVQDNH
jgi:catechol 2,3-dioxygenase-like lactoylglutathione lyase family enzyme